MTPSATAQADGRACAVAAAGHHFDSGAFVADLARRVAIRTESQDPASGPALQAYLRDEIAPSLAALASAASLGQALRRAALIGLIVSLAGCGLALGLNLPPGPLMASCCLPLLLRRTPSRG